MAALINPSGGLQDEKRLITNAEDRVLSSGHRELANQYSRLIPKLPSGICD
jgi:hypothetical protein